MNIDLDKVDKIYVSFVVLLISMAILVTFSFRGVFSLFVTSADINSNSQEVGAKVEKDRLEDVYNWVYHKEATHLEVKD